MLALGTPIGLVAGGAVLIGFMMVKPKVKMEMDMKLNAKTKFGTKMLLAVAWSLVRCSIPRQQVTRSF